MEWLSALIALVLILCTAPLGPWLLRASKSHRGGGMGPALGELSTLFDPSQRHAARAAEARPLERRDGKPPLPA